jgi:hypothetical protein
MGVGGGMFWGCDVRDALRGISRMPRDVDVGRSPQADAAARRKS